jgi:hypothetical protein
MIPLARPALADLRATRRARLEVESDFFKLGNQAATDFPAQRAACGGEMVIRSDRYYRGVWRRLWLLDCVRACVEHVQEKSENEGENRNGKGKTRAERKSET